LPQARKPAFGENVGFFDELLNEGSTYTPEEDWYDD